MTAKTNGGKSQARGRMASAAISKTLTHRSKQSAKALPRRGCDDKPNVGEPQASLRWVSKISSSTPKEFRRSGSLHACFSRAAQTPRQNQRWVDGHLLACSHPTPEYLCLPRNLAVVKRGLTVSQNGLCLGSSGSARIPACCSRHLAANIRQRMTSHPPYMEALMAEERKRMLSASPPDHPPRRYPTLTRLGLVQRWAVLKIPAGDQLRTEKGTSRWFLGGHPLAQSKFFLEEDGATSPTLTSFQRVYVGYGCWRFLLRRSCGGLGAFRIQGSLAGTN